MTLRVGTSGWRHLADFYPSRTHEREMLAVYSQEFSLVEIDSTFQGIPGRDRIAEWSGSVGEDFSFHVLAFGGLCLHQLRPGARPLPGVSWRDYAVEAPEFLFSEFAAALEPLGPKLAVVTLQFPAYFTAGYDSEEYLRQCRANLPGLPLAVEFRDQSWLAGRERLQRTQELLIDWEIALVAADFEAVPEAPPLICATARLDIGVARLHGRSHGAFARQAEDPLMRDRHDYSEDEFDAICTALKPLSEDVDHLDVILRTDPATCIINARRFGAVASTPAHPEWTWQPQGPRLD